MKIGRYQPPAPKPEFNMTFDIDDGWAIVAALHHYADDHPQAVDRDEWRKWADELDRELRRCPRFRS